EAGVIRKAIEPMLKRRMLERRVHCRLEWIPSVADKPTKARAFQAMASMGRVFMEPAADLSEFLVFPAGKHDDEVDTASLMGMVMDQAHPAIMAVKEQRRTPGDRWERALNREEDDSSWKTV